MRQFFACPKGLRVIAFGGVVIGGAPAVLVVLPAGHEVAADQLNERLEENDPIGSIDVQFEASIRVGHGIVEEPDIAHE